MATNWDDELPRCFGIADLKFARHPSDEESAFEWLGSLRKRSVGWSVAKTQIEAYLTSKGAGVDHIKDEIAYARKHLSPWLRD